LKSELDTLRDTLFNEVDETAGQLEEYFKSDSELTALNEYLKEQQVVQENLITKYEDSLKKNLDRIQKFHDTLFKIEFEPEKEEIDPGNTIGIMNTCINKQLQDTNWKYKYDNFNEEKMRCLRTFQCDNELEKLEFLGNDKLAGYTFENENVKIWNISDGSLIRDLKGAGRIRAAVQGNRLITTLRRPLSSIFIWDLDTFEKKVIESEDYHFNLIELENGTIASVSIKEAENEESHYKITLWKLDGLNLKKFKVTRVEESEFNCLEPLKDEFFASNDQSDVLIWSCSQPEPLHTITTFHNGEIKCMKYIKNRNVLLTALYDLRVIFWNYETGEKLREIRENDFLINIIDLGDGSFVNQTLTSLGVFSVDNAEFVGEVFKSKLSKSMRRCWDFVKLPNGQYASAADTEIKILDFKAKIQYY